MFHPATVTFPPAAALIGVPVDVAISNPLCPEELLPNLVVITPETGLIRDTPRFTLASDIPDTLPEYAVATYVTFGASYNLDTLFSTDVKSFVLVSYFSTIPKSFLLALFFFFNFAITSSASLNVETYTFSFLSSVIA